MNARSHVSRGIGAGAMAAATFAALFFAVDSIQGHPFRTPAYLSHVVVPGTVSLPPAAGILLFTILHFAAFIAVAIIVSMLLESAEIAPSVPLGMALGFMLFDVVFYSAVLLRGVNIVNELGWPQLLAANVAAGAVMLGFLRLRSGLRVMDVQGALARHEIVRAGLITGLLGGAVVAVWFLIIDALRGQVFYTPAALGSAVFYGVSTPADVVIRPSVVLGYTLVHFAAFVLAGLVAARLMDEAEKHPPVILGVALFFTTLEVLSLGVLSAMAAWLFETVPWWSPIVANLLAGAAMAAYLWQAHPGLHGRFSEALEEPEGATKRRYGKAL